MPTGAAPLEVQMHVLSDENLEKVNETFPITYSILSEYMFMHFSGERSIAFTIF